MVEYRSWGHTPEGKEVRLYTLENRAGYRASVATYGATLTSLKTPVSGALLDVVLGFDNLRDYLEDGNYFGATVGRTANRISGASFELNGKKYFLDKNEGENNLHGGKKGFSSRVWTPEQNTDENGNSITLLYLSPDGEGGYPGNLRAKVTYTLLENGLRIDHEAETDSPTPVNMTAHPYFNLLGNGEDVGKHELKIFANKTLALDKNFIPTGEIISTAGTEADFTDFSPITAISGQPVSHDRFYPSGLKTEMASVAIARCAERGLELEIATTLPGIQFYSGEGIPSGTIGKNGCSYGPRSGFCIEPQFHPDAPNKKEFPSVILRPGETYRHSTEYRFRRINRRG